MVCRCKCGVKQGWIGVRVYGLDGVASFRYDYLSMFFGVAKGWESG